YDSVARFSALYETASYITWRKPGTCVCHSRTRARVDGLSSVPESSTIRWPAATVARSRGSICASTSGQVTVSPCHSGPLRRSASYSDRTVAWPDAQVPPLVSGEDSLPSILIGRPSRVFTSSPQPEEQPPQVVAYHDATPGVISSGLTRNGIAFWTV